MFFKFFYISSFLALFIISPFLVGCSPLTLEHTKDQRIPVRVISPEPSSISQSLQVKGVITSDRYLPFILPLPLQVVRWFVQDSDEVNQGDKIMEFTIDLPNEYKIYLHQWIGSLKNISLPPETFANLPRVRFLEELFHAHRHLLPQIEVSKTLPTTLIYTSPFKGKISIRKSGDKLRSLTEPLFTLYDSTNLGKITIPIGEELIKTIDETAPIRIEVPEFPQQITGMISTKEKQNITIQFPLNNQEKALLLGKQAFVKLHSLGRPSDQPAGFKLPKQAVLRDTEHTYVYYVQNGKAKKQVVGVGKEDGKFIEIVHGITPNQSIVVEGMEHLYHDAEVEVMQEENE